ncbi:MAG: murein tripeptide amidase MpaA [Verrucomicrobiota bacterium]
MNFRAREERGDFASEPEEYGRSVLGAPLEVWLPASGEVSTLLVAGQHGEEAESTFVLSRALRCLEGAPSAAGVVLASNPDGMARATRGNANGVDLNRNYPTADWTAEGTTYCWQVGAESEVTLSTGSEGGSEPETRAFMGLVERLQPKRVIALHAPLACIDDPQLSDMGKELSEESGLPLVESVGYATPGSFGTWAGERGLHVITYEFPRASLEELAEIHVPIFYGLMVEERG